MSKVNTVKASKLSRDLSKALGTVSFLVDELNHELSNDHEMYGDLIDEILEVQDRVQVFDNDTYSLAAKLDLVPSFDV